jgi:hypothetical protein
MVCSQISRRTYNSHAGSLVTEITNWAPLEQLITAQSSRRKRAQIDAGWMLQPMIGPAAIDATGAVLYGARAPNREVKQEE